MYGVVRCGGSCFVYDVTIDRAKCSRGFGYVRLDKFVEAGVEVG